MIRVSVIIVLCILVACSRQNRVNKFSDALLVKIADLQDRRQSDSLYQFFSHENSAYRKDAVLAFASIQDTLAVDQLKQVLMKDADQNVRAAAAYALGQTGTLKSFWALMDAFVREKEIRVQREIIEACGKSASREAAIKLEPFEADKLGEAFAWYYYRFGSRGLADSTVVKKVIPFLTDSNGLSTRIGAANFFARGPREIASAESALQKSSLEDPSADVRMATTSALRKIITPGTLAVIKKILATDSDYRVRVNAVRVLPLYPLKDTKQNFIDALNDSNINVAVAASEALNSVTTKDDFSELVSLARAAKNWRVKGNLFHAAIKWVDNKELFEEIKKLYSTEQNPYAKASLLSALRTSILALPFINEQLHQSDVPVIRSTAAGALETMNRVSKLTPALQKDFAEIYKKAFETSDAAVIGVVAATLADSTLGDFKNIITDYTFLYDAKKKLSLPKDNEALQPLEAAIAYFEGKKFSNEVKNEFNHPIDWNLVKTIPANQKVLIKTGKGDITLQLLVEEAPGSVANFVQLVNIHYFDSKNFHRVVPNFVIQGGCNRGDGWGSEDYSIRSEFSMRRYAEGSVGMASAGKDTEGTQWFITHSPTPHLDGRYTIFAIVTDGMEVVHQMEVGDQILKVELIRQ